MKVELKVEVEIEPVDWPEPARDDPRYGQMISAARSAVLDALQYAEGEGFIYPMQAETSIEVKKVEILRPRLPKGFGPRDWMPEKR